MKTTFYKVAVTVLLMVLLTPLLKAQEIKVMDNIDASAKAVYFNLTTGQEVAAATKDWDIAFERTTILVNSGSSGPGNTTALLLKGVTFESVDSYPASGFKTDTDSEKAIPSGSGNGWYEYNMANHSINPIPERVIVVKTTQGKYVKLEILSYYHKSNQQPANYSFRYSFLN